MDTYRKGTVRVAQIISTEDTWLETLSYTEHECPGCAENIALDDEVFILTVEAVGGLTDGVQHQPILAIDGDYAWEPRILCFTCWENAMRDREDDVRGQPPSPHILVNGNAPSLTCNICSEPLYTGDNVGSVTKAEIILSPRQPECCDTTTFTSMYPPTVICTECMEGLDLDLWVD